MSTSTTSLPARLSPEGATESMYQVRLLSALRSGDPAQIHPFLADLGKDRRKSAQGDVDLGAAALHLAIRCASCDTVSLLLSHRSISPNAVHPPRSGTTPLHLAASLSRADVVSLLLEQEGIDDTLRDTEGRTCLQVAKGKDTIGVIKESRIFLTSSYRSLLRTYVLSSLSSRMPDALITLLSSPRSRLIDLSYLDDASGTALLHEAARRKDLRGVELAVRAGADIFVRDRKGRTVLESVGKDEKVKVFLKQFTNQDTSLIEPPSLDPPEHKGYLNKYTNVAKGWNTRWFVLKNGVLSYYRHQEDENIASRGSIAMKSAILKPTPGSGCLRFEVCSSSSTNSSSSNNTSKGSQQKWYMKANHPVEASRWINALQKSMEYARKEEQEEEARRRSWESGRFSVSTGISVSMSGVGLKEGPYGKGKRGNGGSGMASNSNASSVAGDGDGEEDPNDVITPLAAKLGTGNASGDDDVEHSSMESNNERKTLPYSDSFELQGNSTLAQVELTAQMLGSFFASSSSSSSSTSTSTSASPTPPSQLTSAMPNVPTPAFLQTLHTSLQTAHTLLRTYVHMVHSREEYYKHQLEHERQRQDVWEESLRTVVKEGEVMETELRERARRGSRILGGGEGSFGEGMGTGTVRRRTSVLWLPKPISPPVGVEEDGVLRTVQGLTPPGTISTLRQKSLSRHATLISPPPSATPTIIPTTPTPTTTTTPTAATSAALSASPIPAPGPRPFSLIMSPTSPGATDLESALDTDEEDEFFDAIESNTLPNLIVTDSLISTSGGDLITTTGGGKELKFRIELPAEILLSEEQYGGYKNLRRRLAIGNDNRPPMSLWAVLKNSIGKDLTRISFPVFFNEPTSMLQRMAEDMEFSECLDAAAKELDPHRRIAFVAAFAMSNYSSTIGRIAKPFNPMLNETFEYVRFDKEYRYMSEQVSHHPPISACWAESPLWKYYGEVDAQNKFMGKSFEIRPTGVAHADLLLPEEQAPSYPKAKSSILKGRVVEHYSWKKVTTNVSGFILGSPTIDHYGDMIVTNHRTGDQCVLSFKPRGWRGRDAYEISGYVTDADGDIAYEIAGRWNSQLVARAVGTGVGHLHPDVSINNNSNNSNNNNNNSSSSSSSSSSSISESSSPAAPEYILLWRNSTKPPAPFNLTPFAITLNDCPDDTLRPYLCPTDCRLRPDQRAFELGKYERANELKNKQEEFQRGTRKAREEGRKDAHRPRWFSAETEPDTGERVWAPAKVDGEKLEYWVEREKVWKAKVERNGDVSWKEVDRIFIEDDP